MFSMSAFALLEVADEESLLKIEEALLEHVDSGDLIIEEAWVIDFPSVTDVKFYHVSALLDNGNQKQIFYINVETFEVVNENVILDYQQQESEADEPVFRITSANPDADDNEETDYVRAPEGSEVGIVSVDDDSSNSNGFLYWGIPAGLFIAFLAMTLSKKNSNKK